MTTYTLKSRKSKMYIGLINFGKNLFLCKKESKIKNIF